VKLVVGTRQNADRIAFTNREKNSPYDIGVDGRIILKQVVKKYDEWIWLI
jgi:hypothetical protein